MKPDRALVEWTANAKAGDVLPEPYRHMYGTQALIRRLVEVGVMAEPSPLTPISELVPAAKEAAAKWLDENPVGDPTTQ